MYLGIDCSGITAELALLSVGGCEFIAREDTPRQADVIFALLDKILLDSGTDKKNILAIGAVTGPGSFTGIRVGLALAQGLADGLGIPAYGLNAFDAVKGETHREKDDIVVLESKRAELYVWHDGNIEMLLPAQILRLAGSDKQIMHNLADSSPLAPHPAHGNSMALAAARHAQKYFEAKCSGEILAPYYVREADAKPNAA